MGTRMRLKNYKWALIGGALVCVLFVGYRQLMAPNLRFIELYSLIAVGLVAVIYFTYRIYLKRIETSGERDAQKAEGLVAAIRESEERFRWAFDHAAGMGLLSHYGSWLQVNTSFCKMLG